MGRQEGGGEPRGPGAQVLSASMRNQASVPALGTEPDRDHGLQLQSPHVLQGTQGQDHRKARKGKGLNQPAPPTPRPKVRCAGRDLCKGVGAGRGLPWPSQTVRARLTSPGTRAVTSRRGLRGKGEWQRQRGALGGDTGKVRRWFLITPPRPWTSHPDLEIPGASLKPHPPYLTHTHTGAPKTHPSRMLWVPQPGSHSNT